MTPKMIPKTSKNMQIITRKYLISANDKMLRESAIKLMSDIAKALKSYKLNIRCNEDSDGAVLRCLYELVIMRYEIADAIVKVVKEWKKRMPNLWYDVYYDDDDEPERIDIYLFGGNEIAHIRYYEDILETPLRLKFFVETATHTFSELVNYKTMLKHLWMPLEPVETINVKL
jgi:hypothetical protein